MASYALEPLHSHPEMIQDAISLVKDAWPECLAERLNEIETERCTGLPCSLALTESREGAVKEVLGHVRVVQILPECERRVYIESVTVKKTRRNEGLARKLHRMVESYAKTSLGARYLHASTNHDSGYSFYCHLQYDSFPVYKTQVAANVLRTHSIVTWEGLVVPDEWKPFYEGGSFTTKIAAGIRRFVKDLGED